MSTMELQKAGRPTANIGGYPFYLTADHFAAAIVASSRAMGVNPVRAVNGMGPSRKALAPALFAIATVTGAPFAPLTSIMNLSKTDAYKSRRRGGEAWEGAERAARKALEAVYRAEPAQPARPAPALRVIKVVPQSPQSRPAIVFRKDRPRIVEGLPSVGEKALPDRILEVIATRSLTTNTIATILGAKELAVGDCLTNLMRSGQVTFEDFMDGHVRRKRWSVVA